MANVTTLQEYPFSVGLLFETIIDVQGPASYTIITIGTPPTGGQTVFATDMGFKEIHSIEVMGSDNGQYDAVCYVNSGAGSVGNPPKRAGTQFQMQWFAAAGRTEVTGATNLSARTMRLCITGR